MKKPIDTPEEINRMVDEVIGEMRKHLAKSEDTKVVERFAEVTARVRDKAQAAFFVHRLPKTKKEFFEVVAGWYMQELRKLFSQEDLAFITSSLATQDAWEALVDWQLNQPSPLWLPRR